MAKTTTATRAADTANQAAAEPKIETAAGADMRQATGPAPAAAPIDTMALWQKLQRTDPRATKPFTRSGGFRGTQIDPAWRLKIMTEVFGPVGQGWGYEQLEWTLVERMVFICARVWYRHPDTDEICYTGPQWGGTEIVRRRRDGGESPDDECFKMSMTDAIGKCMLQIGLAADVYLGQFDDSKYREESEAIWEAKGAPQNQPSAIAKFERDVKAKLDGIDDLDSLGEFWRAEVRGRLREIAMVDKAAEGRILGHFSQRKAEIAGEQEAAA